MGLVSSNQQSTIIGATYVPDINPQLVNRVVGSFEYGQALSLLGRFLTSASGEELKVAEQIVSNRDEFTVYTNLSRLLEPRPGPLSERSDVAQDKFAKKGIAWLMALARVELAAMAAGFSPDPEPFAKDHPSRFELAAYSELLQDAMRTHYWSLTRDQTLRTMRRGVTPDQQAIAYLRRTNLATKFLSEVRKERQGQLTSVQQAEMDTWEQQLKSLESHLLYDVLGVHDTAILASSSKGIFLHKCGMTEDQILADIRSGGAKVSGASAEALAAVRKEAGLSVGAANPSPPTATATPAGAAAGAKK